jgi:capsular polysaccharide transport system ATP-binding protein
MIELRNVTKTYPTPSGPNVVLDRISFVFPPRTNVGILGHNGAGKSTLLRLLGGAEFPDAGKVLRKGRCSWPIGFAGGLNGSLTGEENARFVARIYGTELDAVVEYARQFAEIGEYFYMPVRTYSSGMRARLAFGLSMALDFDTYLVDEVTAVGDQKFRDKCKQEFLGKQDTRSMIIVSHQLKTIKEYCNLFCVLRDGKLHVFEKITEAKRAYQAA